MKDLLTMEGIAREGGVLEGYAGLRIDGFACSPALAEDLRGIVAARWLADVLRSDFETASFGAAVRGSLGSFDGVAAEEMPGYWRKTEEGGAGLPVWQPDARHPVGKWFADIAARLLPVPPPEVVHAVLRRHGIEGSKYPAPQMIETEGGWAVLVHQPKSVRSLKGVTREDSLMQLFLQAGTPAIQ